jgi:hypothetical protein
MVPDVLVDSDRVDPGEAIRVVGELGEQREVSGGLCKHFEGSEH